jgi:hypothetical protein
MTARHHSPILGFELNYRFIAIHYICFFALYGKKPTLNMKRLLLLASLVAFAAAPSYAGKCEKNCKACKNCKYCKRCAKDSGTCSVCKK